jgi:hypothetical protein
MSWTKLQDATLPQVIDLQTTNDAVAQFMARVVPWPVNGEPGFISVYWHLPGERFLGRAACNVEELLRVANTLAQSTQSNIYFCLSLQAEAGKRNKKNALAFKAIWLDLDVKPDGYATIKEAIDALFAFIDHYRLPPPSAIVLSGSGLHVYWFSDRPLPYAEWHRYAEGLKAAVLQWGLKCDAGCTADAARVLRIPGTRNFKTDPPKCVHLQLLLDKDFDFATELKPLLEFAPSPRTNGKNNPLKGQKVADAFAPFLDANEDLVKGIEFPESQPVDFALVKAGCGWLREVHDTDGKDQREPLWWFSLKVCLYLKNGAALFMNSATNILTTIPRKPRKSSLMSVRTRKPTISAFPNARPSRTTAASIARRARTLARASRRWIWAGHNRLHRNSFNSLHQQKRSLGTRLN